MFQNAQHFHIATVNLNNNQIHFSFPNCKHFLEYLNQFAKGNGINGFLDWGGKETVNCFLHTFKASLHFEERGRCARFKITNNHENF